MDIVCAKCGKHFNSVEAAREHSRTCSVRASNEPAYTESSNNSVLSPKELEKLIAIKQKHSNENGKDVNNSPTNSNTSNEPPKKTPNRHIKAHKSIPNWLLVLLVLFAGSFLVWGISVAIRTFMPLWLLFGFFFIYFVENFLIVALSKFSKLLLNLSLLSIIGLIIWTGIRLFSGEFSPNSIIGSIVFITELILFFWTCKIIVNNKRRRPSMKLTVFSLVILFLILAFAGVKPLSDYKDTALQNISEWWENTTINAKNTSSQINDSSKQPASTQPTTHTPGPSFTSTPVPTKATSSTQTKPTGIDNGSGEYKNYYLGLVKAPDGVISGEGCYGDFIVLINNKDAHDPTYAELLKFLKSDTTDEFPYQYSFSFASFYYGEAEDKIDLAYIKDIIDGISKPENPCICADFAERLHNNAEMAGIRCAYVSLDMTGYTDPENLGIESDAGHACNAFQTTDKGLVFIDCTGDLDGYGPSSHDTIVTVELGKDYNPKYLFESSGWYIPEGVMGIVTNIFITWDGEWRD